MQYLTAIFIIQLPLNQLRSVTANGMGLKFPYSESVCVCNVLIKSTTFQNDVY